MKLFNYLLTASDAVKKVLKADIQARLIRRGLEGKIDSLETKSMTLESDLANARQALAVAQDGDVNTKLQKIVDLKLEQEACAKAQVILQEELKVLFEDEYTPPPEAVEAAKRLVVEK